MKWSGQRLPRVEDPSLLKGLGKYVADLCTDTKIVHFIRSPVANGKILDVSSESDINLITAKDILDIKIVTHKDGKDKVVEFQYRKSSINEKFSGQWFTANHAVITLRRR